MTCPSDYLQEQVTCIFTYDGSIKDILINYTLFLLNVIIAAIPLLLPVAAITHRTRNNDLHKRRLCALSSLSFVSMFQVILCLLVKCNGISIIWCAIAAWIWMDYRTFKRGRDDDTSSNITTNCRNGNYKIHQITVMVIDTVAIIYYAIVMEPITTVAHILAIVVLGIPLYILTDKISIANDYSDISSLSPQTNLLD